jgi:hypothetical protein
MLTLSQALNTSPLRSGSLRHAIGGIARFPAASGFFVDREGLLLTNHHVVWDAASRIPEFVNRAGLEHGFLANEPSMELRIPDLYVDVPRLDCPELWNGEDCTSPIEDAERFVRLKDIRIVFLPSLEVVYLNTAQASHCFFDCAVLRAYHQGQPYCPPARFDLKPHALEPGQRLSVTGFPTFTRRNVHPLDLRQELHHRVRARQHFLERRRSFLRSKQRFGNEFQRISSEQEILAASKLVTLDKHVDPPNPGLERLLGAERELLEEEQCAGLLGSKALRLLLVSSALSEKRGALLWGDYSVGGTRAEVVRWLERSSYFDEIEESHDLEYAIFTLRETLPETHVILAMLNESPPLEVVRGARVIARAACRGEPNQHLRESSLVRLGSGLVDWAVSLRERLERVRDHIALINDRHVLEQASGEPWVRDANRSPRTTFGRVRGWTHASKSFPAILTGEDVLRRASRFPMRQAFTALLSRVSKQALHVYHEGDVCAGMSGSPVCDEDGKVVGLLVGGNQYSLAGRWRKLEEARAVSLSICAMLEMIRFLHPSASLVRKLSRSE